MMRLHGLSLLIVSAALCCGTQRASAQTPYSYPWCGTNGGGESCYYATLEQCIATTMGGRGGRCVPSPYYRHVAPPPVKDQLLAVSRTAAPPLAMPRVDADSAVVRHARAAAPRGNPEYRAVQSTGAAPSRASEVLAAQDYAATVTAAEQGDVIAQYNLAAMYDSGRGVLQDYVQAHKWYNLAAARYSTWEADIGATAVRNRDRLTARMTPAQIAEAQKLAREWEPKQGR